MAAGDALFTALEQYYGTHKAYPDRLDQLVPQFIPKVPALPDSQWQWDYRVYPQTDGFALRFKGSRPKDWHYTRTPKTGWKEVKVEF